MLEVWDLQHALVLCRGCGVYWMNVDFDVAAAANMASLQSTERRMRGTLIERSRVTRDFRDHRCAPAP
jgi:hypothetical protein